MLLGRHCRLTFVNCADTPLSKISAAAEVTIGQTLRGSALAKQRDKRLTSPPPSSSSPINMTQHRHRCRCPRIHVTRWAIDTSPSSYIIISIIITSSHLLVGSAAAADWGGPMVVNGPNTARINILKPFSSIVCWRHVDCATGQKSRLCRPHDGPQVINHQHTSLVTRLDESVKTTPTNTTCNIAATPTHSWFAGGSQGKNFFGVTIFWSKLSPRNRKGMQLSTLWQ